MHSDPRLMIEGFDVALSLSLAVIDKSMNSDFFAFLHVILALLCFAGNSGNKVGLVVLFHPNVKNELLSL